jgi:hypothetical protein
MLSCCKKEKKIININTFKKHSNDFPVNGWIFPCIGLSDNICGEPISKTIIIDKYEINMCSYCQKKLNIDKNEKDKVYKICKDLEFIYELRMKKEKDEKKVNIFIV